MSPTRDPDRIVLGRHLIHLGYRPAPWFGSILERCYQAQLDGVFEVEADGIDYLKAELSLLPSETRCKKR